MATEERTVTEIYCCKKWVNGVLKKYQSQNPCSGEAVACDQPDPPKPPTPGTCEEDCRSNQEYLLLKGPNPAAAEEMLQKCLEACKGTPGVFCEGGHELPYGSSTCEEGMKLKTDPVTGKHYCCPDDTPPGPGENPCDEGGYQLTAEVGFPGGQADNKAPWEEVPGTERSDLWEGHMVWSPAKNAYVNTTDPEGETYDLVCKKGWIRKKDSEGGIWCCPDGGNGDDGSEFKWGEGLQGLLARITERANELLDYPRGLRPEERQAVINYAIEGVKSGEAGAKQTSRDELARMGMLGSGFEASEMGRIARETRQKSGDVRRELAIDELDRRFNELMGTTGMVQGLTGTLMQGEQIPEVLSGARRAEGQAAINTLLSYLAGSNQGDNGYTSAILSQLLGNQGQSGTSDMSWLYYLPYLIK